MSEIWVRAWADWSSGEPKPVFTVMAEIRGEPSIEKLKTFLGARRLENELRQLSENINELVPHAWVDPEKGYSLQAFYAMIFLAAVRANVNPTRIKFIHTIGTSPEEPYIRPYSVHQVIYDLENEIFNPIFEMIKVMDRLRFSLGGADISTTRWASGESAETFSEMDGKPDVYIQHSITSFLWRVPDIVWAFEFKKSRLFAQDIRGIFRRASKEARYPDVRRLAELLERMIDGAVRITSELSHHLDFRALSKLSDRPDQPEKFKELKKEALKELERAIDWAQAIVCDVKPLISEARKIAERLNMDSILLPQIYNES